MSQPDAVPSTVPLELADKDPDLPTEEEMIEYGLVPPRSGKELLDSVCAFIERFISLSSAHQLHVLALWVLHTHALEAADCTPYLAITSPERGCGKTQLFDTLECLVHHGWKIDGLPTEAVLFRKVELDRPTVLLDEADRLFKSNADRVQPLTALLNGGNRRGATVPRCIPRGKDFEIRDFATFCPKALAGIDHRRWPDTIRDRSIVIRLQKIRPGGSVERWRPRRVEPEAFRLRAELEQWAEANADALGQIEPEELDFVSPRTFDGWEPLLAIAERAGGEWSIRAVEAVRALSGKDDPDEDSVPTLILRAVRDHFGDADNCFTRELLERINLDEDYPFGGWREGKGLTGRALSQALRGFEIPNSRSVRKGDDVARGYHREWFEDAWSRYLPVSTESVTSVTKSPGGRYELLGQAEIEDVTDVTGVTAVSGMAQRGVAEFVGGHL